MGSENNIYERLETVMNYKKVNRSKFAKMLEISNSQIGGMLKGSDFGISKLIAITKLFPEISTEWLLRGEGEMILRETDKPASIEEIERTYKQTIEELKEEITWLKEHARDLALILKTQNEPENEEKPLKKRSRKEKNVV